MVRNFVAMPVFVKMFTLIALAIVGLFIISSLPGRTTIVFGRPMTASELWSSGLQSIVALHGVIMGLSAALMLRRSRWGIDAYILGWIGLSLSPPLMAYIARANIAGTIASVANSLAATAAMWLYLSKSAAVRSYFDRLR